MIPIEKNIIVTDVNGNTIGSTYPKRAKGLVKNGRAEYADDHTIRLKFTHAPTVTNITEDKNMSKVIDFNAREFRLDPDCQSNKGDRMFMSTPLGNTEVWEIGDWQWSWTQIFCVKTLEKNTDYVFRFAMTGGHNDVDDAVSHFILFATDGYDTDDEAWENRMTFALARSRYEPVISKRDKSGLVRVFEIPFSTGDHESFKFMFIAQHAIARFFAPGDLTAYEQLEDLTYDEWFKERRAYLEEQSWEQNMRRKNFRNKYVNENDYDEDAVQNHAPQNGIPDLSGVDFSKLMNGGNIAQMGVDIRKAIDQALKGIDQNVYNNMTIEANNFEYTEKQFAELMRKVDDGYSVSLSNITVHPDGSGEHYDIGSCADGAAMDIDNADLTAKAFSMIINKLGDGCAVSMANIEVSHEGLNEMYSAGSPCDGAAIDLNYATLPQAAFDLINAKLGDGCNISTDNCTIK